MDISALYELYLKHPSVQTDTRKLQSGDLFFALKGPSFDGNAFAAAALQQGAAYAIVDDPAACTDERCILVDDVLHTLQSLATHHRKQFNIPFLAITGSNGKTTTKELITAVLRRKFVTYSTTGNLNNHIGIPLTLLSIGRDAEIAVIEMGANHLHEIEGYCHIALPTHGLITNCGKAHIEGFGSVENIRKGKGELFVYLRETGGAIFRNADLPYLADMAKDITAQITYGMGNARYTGRPVQDGLFLGVALLNHGSEALIGTHLVGDYNFPNVMAAVAVGHHFGVPADEVRIAIEGYRPDNSRSQWVRRGGNQVILDAYNANPSSMRAAILNFAALDLPEKILWLGGMKEMGAEEQAEHQALVDLIREHSWKEVVLVGKEFEGVKGDYSWFETSADAAVTVSAQPPVNAAILIKGSRGSRMEQLLEALPA